MECTENVASTIRAGGDSLTQQHQALAYHKERCFSLHAVDNFDKIGSLQPPPRRRLVQRAGVVVDAPDLQVARLVVGGRGDDPRPHLGGRRDGRDRLVDLPVDAAQRQAAEKGDERALGHV